MEIGGNIKVIRKERKLTQEQLAKVMNLSRSYLSDLENNRKNPSSKTIELLAEKLNVSMLYLTTGKKTLNDLDDNELKKQIEFVGDNIKAENYNVSKFVKKSLKELSDSELESIVSQYLANVLIFLRTSNEEELRTLTVFIVQLIKNRNIGKHEYTNQEELLEFIEGLTKEFKDFLIHHFHYKAGD
ncbi:helix-turn-helix domain-containing protein [Aquibacillus kalidii]|uniref:helix-turn-helix domain-containing protein n=1 Tax=Aquibacillus kalidii TaxID=2762597 RepID=UPI0016449EC6|nr:helix-turn-helix domain-containing protein [Aquibacillus kalidii]